MSSKKPAIPPVPTGTERKRFDQAVKENIETLTGARGTKVATLPANASLGDVIEKMNELIGVLQ